MCGGGSMEADVTVARGQVMFGKGWQPKLLRMSVASNWIKL